MSKNKYEPTPEMKRRIKFNADIEKAIQEFRKLARELGL